MVWRAQPAHRDFPLAQRPSLALYPARKFETGERTAMKFRIALTAAASLALAACGSSEDASTEAEADTVEMTADEALTDVEEMPVEDPAANTAPVEMDTASPSEEAEIQEAGDSAADTAAAAMDAMAEDAN
jgi:hypothetical protein